jgi:hypothetical protein
VSFVARLQCPSDVCCLSHAGATLGCDAHAGPGHGDGDGDGDGEMSPPPSDGRACLASRCAHRSCLAHIRSVSAEAPFGKGRTLRESTVQLSVAASPYRELHLDPVGPCYITLQTTVSAPAATPSRRPAPYARRPLRPVCTAWQHSPHPAAPLRACASFTTCCPGVRELHSFLRS